MLILIELIVGIACFFGGIFGCCLIDSRTKSRFLPCLFMSCLLGVPVYVAAAVGALGWNFSLLAHACLLALYLLVVLTHMQNEIEGYVVVLMISILLSTLIPTLDRARELHIKSTTSKPQTANERTENNPSTLLQITTYNTP